MTPEDSVLIHVLAASDAIWRVPRRTDWLASDGAIVMSEYRRRFSRGVPWTAGGTSSERKRRERGLLAMASAGLIVIHGSGKGKSVKLSEEGEHHARAICGLPSLQDGWWLLRDAVKLAVIHEYYGPLVREAWLCRPPLRHCTEGDQPKLQVVADHAAPALCRGWLDAKSDVRSHACYVPTPLGVAIVEQGCPEAPADTPDEIDGARELYYRAVLDCREQIRMTRPDNRAELGQIPISASISLPEPEGLFDDGDE